MYKELQKISLTGTGARMYERQCTLQGGWRLFAASVKAAQFRQPPFRVLPTGSKQGAHAALLSQSSTAPQPTGSKQRARAAILLLFRFVFPAMISSATFVSTIRAKRLKAAYGRFAFKVGSPASMRPHFESRLFIPPYRWYSLRLRDWRKTLRSTTSAKQHCAPAYGAPSPQSKRLGGGLCPRPYGGSPLSALRSPLCYAIRSPLCLFGGGAWPTLSENGVIMINSRFASNRCHGSFYHNGAFSSRRPAPPPMAAILAATPSALKGTFAFCCKQQWRQSLPPPPPP